MDLEAALAGTPHEYESRLDIIKKHSETVWKKDTVHHKHYTLHGLDHYSAVISVLNKLVDGINPDSELTIPEIFYLLASVYLHDVGMLISHTEDEDKAKAISTQKKKPFTKEDLIRDEHHLRSGKYVSEHAGDLKLDHVEAGCVKSICEGHRVVKLDTTDYDDKIIDNEYIRVRLLAALLRFSDELDVSYKRAPKELMDVLKEDMSDYSLLHWLKHYYTSGVGIIPQQSSGKRRTIIDIEELIRYHSTNESTSDELDWDFSDLAAPIKNLDSSKRILIEDLISLIQNKTSYPAIRIDQVNIEYENADDCAEVFHPFVGHKTITKNGDSLGKIIKNLRKENIEINIDESAVMGIKRDIALMTIGFLHKKGFIDFNEIAPNILKIGLTDIGTEKISKSAK